jgi:hypothetical protein
MEIRVQHGSPRFTSYRDYAIPIYRKFALAFHRNHAKPNRGYVNVPTIRLSVDLQEGIRTDE